MSLDRKDRYPKGFFSATGRDDVVSVRHNWKNDERCPSEVSMTISSLIQNFYTKIEADTDFDSSNPREAILAGRPLITCDALLTLERAVSATALRE